jgi:Domain of unknown function (DUF1841)
MKSNKIIREQVLLVVENQLRDNNPPATRQTYNRLLQSGISDADARIYIGQCVSVELFHIMKDQKPFNEKRYIKNLHNLPKEPFEDA